MVTHKVGRPRKVESDKRISKRVYATEWEHAFIREWLDAGGRSYEETGKDKRK